MYRLFGYSDDCVDFDFKCTFVQLIKFCRRNRMYVIFTSGLQPKTLRVLEDRYI